MLTAGLRAHNYAAEGVCSGKEAIARCEKGDLDLLLLSIGLSDMPGYDVLRRIKGAPAMQNTAVILVTPKAAGEDCTHGYTMGACAYIAKPYNLPMVMVRVDAALRAKQSGFLLAQEPNDSGDPYAIDSLTGLKNHHYLIERLQAEVEESRRYGQSLSCVVFDVDEIRAEDEELGPVSLDDLLVELGYMIRDASRCHDVLARYDGTMFAVILPHTQVKQAAEYAAKIVKEVDATTFADPCFPTTARLSAGVATCEGGTCSTAEHLLGEAMQGLLQAKSTSCKRVIIRNLDEK